MKTLSSFLLVLAMAAFAVASTDAAFIGRRATSPARTRKFGIRRRSRSKPAFVVGTGAATADDMLHLVQDGSPSDALENPRKASARAAIVAAVSAAAIGGARHAIEMILLSPP